MSRQDPGWLRMWWPLFLVLGGLAFAVPETIALVAPGDGGTLSEMTREWLGIAPDGTGGTVGWVILTVILGGFAIWVIASSVVGCWWRSSRVPLR